MPATRRSPPTARIGPRDGQVLFGIQNNREWATFATEVLRRPELADDARFAGNHLRVEHRDAMDAEIDAVVRPALDRGGRSRGWMPRRSPTPASTPSSSSSPIRSSPAATPGGRWNRPSDALPALVPPVRMEDVEPAMRPIPDVGEHSAAILAELGFDEATISLWKAEQVF